MNAIYINEDKITRIQVSFSDEGVDLVGETTIIGDEQKAADYLPFFERDLRRNFADQFPQPELPDGGMMGGIE